MGEPMKILAIVAHPDDEVLGAGGTLARHASRGDEVHIAFLTDGVGARGDDQAAARRRAAAAAKAASLLGARPPRFLGFPDNRLDSVALLDVAKSIEEVVASVTPYAIYTHHLGDLNIDHVICHRAVMTACRPLPASSVRQILAMEIPSSTEWAPEASRAFTPNCFIEISATRAAKQRALAAYAEEMREFPHPRSVESITALENWRGAAAGLACAEAFMVLRYIED
ncbi:MAG: PIG-L family deacetylase [Hyphomicrobiales bacterium]|nr:PIG-L family deacetylase [Hyphomicrobiales bacterium]